MLNHMKTSHSQTLLCTTLLALSLQTYPASNFAADSPTPAVSPAPKASVAVSATPAPLTTADIIAKMIQHNVATAAWQKQASEELYRLSGQQFVWINNANTDAALELLAKASERVLESEDYNTQALTTEWQTIKTAASPTFEELVRFDTALSNSVITYLSDLGYGQVNPQKVSFDFNVNKEHLKLAASIFSATKDGNFKAVADQLEPTFVLYQRMKKALLDHIAAEKLQKEFKFTHSVSAGHSDGQVAQLRQFLTALGDMEAAKTETVSTSPVYDEALLAGVKHFQNRLGLAGNGSLNSATLAALNAPLTNKIEQIKLSVERLRWLPKIEEDRLVIVNIPSFRLWAFQSLKDEKAEPLSMRVVVGKTDGKKTPSFSSKMKYVEFRPTWTVPQSIIKHEFGNLLRNPGALAKRNMKVSYHNGKISVRQASGDHNALGLVKFLFPNNHSVYFHDTPSKHFFNQTRRDFSHGCVRLGEPDVLAEFALKHQKKGAWTKDQVKQAMQTGGQKRVVLEEPIPVVIFYGTALALDNTGVHFYQDVYGHDPKLTQALDQSKKSMPKKKK